MATGVLYSKKASFRKRGIDEDTDSEEVKVTSCWGAEAEQGLEGTENVELRRKYHSR